MNQFLNKRENCLCHRRAICCFQCKTANCAHTPHTHKRLGNERKLYNHHGHCSHADFIVSHSQMANDTHLTLELNPKQCTPSPLMVKQHQRASRLETEHTDGMGDDVGCGVVAQTLALEVKCVRPNERKWRMK